MSPDKPTLVISKALVEPVTLTTVAPVELTVGPSTPIGQLAKATETPPDQNLSARFADPLPHVSTTDTLGVVDVSYLSVPQNEPVEQVASSAPSELVVWDKTTSTFPLLESINRPDENVQVTVVSEGFADPKAVARFPAESSVRAYFQAPAKSSDWIKTFIEKYYLSDLPLSRSDFTIYASKVAYFGQVTSVDDIARTQESYYRTWPTRHYALIPNSLSVSWPSEDAAAIEFKYRFAVADRHGKRTSGIGRGELTLAFRSRAAQITREDGEVLSGNSGGH